MNRLFFQSLDFTLENLRPWPCPSCELGRIRFEADSLFKTPDASTRRYETWDEFDPRDSSWHFSASWRCDDMTCGEVVHMIGKAGWDLRGEEDENGQLQPVEEIVYRPKYILPALPLFFFPDGTPRKVKDALLAGFSLAPSDPNAAANQLRSAVEIWLNELGIAYAKTLHSRIELLTTPYDVLRNELRAIKWLGNDGSHAHGIDREHMIIGYTIMEKCLQSVYDGINEKVAAINQHKGAIPKRRGFRLPS